MDWIAWTTIMFTSSILLYVGVRELKKYELPTPVINLGMLGLPIIPTVLLLLIQGDGIGLAPIDLILITISVILFSFGGNIASIKGQNLAPNPGFSLIIQKGYGSFTILLAPFLFGSVLAPIEVFGAVVVLVSSALVSIDFSKNVLGQDKRWLIYTALAYFFFGFLSISSKHFLESGVSVIEILVIIFSVNLVISSFQAVRKRNEFKLNRRSVLLLCALGLFSFIFNLSQIEAFDLAPNIGFVNTANAGSIAALAVISRIVYKDQLNALKVIGIIGVMFGLVLIFV